MIGQEHTMPAGRQVINYLKKSIEKSRISHAYLFEGPERSEKKEVALWFAKSLGCRNPDITQITVLEDKKEIIIEQIRELRRYLGLSPHSSPYKVAIVYDAEKMNSEAANAFLKTLEEPKGNAVLILITSTLSALPDTIISRCEEIKFKPDSLDKISKEYIKKEHIDILQKSLSDIFKHIEQIAKDESGILSFLNSWLFWFRDLMVKNNNDKYVRIIKEIQRTKDLILNTNINKRLALENLALCIKS